MLKKKKLLVTSNSSFSDNVFYSYMYSVRQNAVLCGNGLTLAEIEIKRMYTLQIMCCSNDKLFCEMVGKIV